MLRMTPDDLARLRSYAVEQSRSAAPAALFLLRAGLASPPEPYSSVAPVGPADLLTELAFHNLVATEQVIQLLETIVRDGRGAADRVLPAAARAAHARLAQGEAPVDAER
jgi:hypothetical protein